MVGAKKLTRLAGGGYALELAQDFSGVCPECIADDALRRFVAGNGAIEVCDLD